MKQQLVFLKSVLLSCIVVVTTACTAVAPEKEAAITCADSSKRCQQRRDKTARPSPAATPAPQQSQVSADTIKQAQQILQAISYYNGQVSGVLDGLTFNALKQFQTAYGIQATGALTTETFTKLKELEADIKLAPPPLNASTPPVAPLPAASKPIIIEAKGFERLSNPELYKLAAYLKDLGYYSGQLSRAVVAKQNVKTALNEFQKAIGKHTTGSFIDNKTWAKLKSVRLSPATQKELNILLSQPQDVTASPSTTRANQTARLRPLPPSPPQLQLPNFKLVTGQNVFAIEDIQCRNKNEAWVTFYEGTLERVSSKQSQVKTAIRYALWYDTRKQGIFAGDWWCIPRQRFCYAPVKFTDWHGRKQANQIYQFNTKFLLPTNTTLGRNKGIASLAAHLADKQCHFKKKR